MSIRYINYYKFNHRLNILINKDDIKIIVAHATIIYYTMLRGEKNMNQDFSRIGRSISIIDRLMKMYYEKGLAEYEIGWGQQFYLELIHDNPGISPQHIAEYLHVDKATVTKVVNYLCKINYITIETDEIDKRVRHIYASPVANPAVERIKALHQKFYEHLTEDILEIDAEKTKADLDKMICNLSQHVWHRMEAGNGN